MREQQPVPPAGAGAERADADEVGRGRHRRARWAKFGQSETSISGASSASRATSGSNIACSAVHQVVPQRLLLGRLGRAALLARRPRGRGRGRRRGTRSVRRYCGGGVGDALLVLQDQELLRVVAGEHAPELRRVLAALDRVGGDGLHARVGASRSSRCGTPERKRSIGSRNMIRSFASGAARAISRGVQKSCM